MVFHHLPANHIIGMFRPITLEKLIFELGIGGEGQTHPEILRVVLGPCAQYYPKYKLKEKELSYCHHPIRLEKTSIEKKICQHRTI